jgi:hypothetical protein
MRAQLKPVAKAPRPEAESLKLEEVSLKPIPSKPVRSNGMITLDEIGN